MGKRPQHLITELNEHDRKVLDKYTKFFTNFIESNTADTDMLENKRYHEEE